MSKNRFTHKAKIYGIPCYFNESDMEVKGTNWFYDFLIDIGNLIETTFPKNDSFVFTHVEEIKKPTKKTNS